jgi:hypothetical protein
MVKDALYEATHSIIDRVAEVLATALLVIQRNSHFFLALASTLLFYYPALINKSLDAGFLYTGDVLGYYMPALAKTHQLIRGLNFTAIDFSLFHGSSDFFLSPNFFAVHPLVVLFCLAVPTSSVDLQSLGRMLVWMYAFHSFVACYFSTKLFTRFFTFDFGAAAFVATTFAFSVQMVSATGQPPFLFSASVVSWAAYSALSFSSQPTLRNLFFASLPTVLGLLGGYLPLGIASLWLSLVFVVTKIFFLDENDASVKVKMHAQLIAITPYLVGLLVVSPYLYSVYAFHLETSSAKVPSLFYSAHQLAELPQTFFRLLSSRLSVPGPAYEFSLHWGFAFITIFLLFLTSTKASIALSTSQWTLLRVSATGYFLSVLATFGEFSVVSDWVFYLIPQVGKMHIYQRFLLAGQLCLSLMIAVMLQALMEVRPQLATRIVLSIAAIVGLIAAYVLVRHPTTAQEAGLNNYIIYELFLAFLLAAVFLVPGKLFVHTAVVFLACLPAMDGMYDRAHNGNTYDKQRERQKFALDSREREKIVAFLKRNSSKSIVKYVDITPMWNADGIESFPKNFPHFVLNELQLTSYGGFTFYLSSISSYSTKMPVSGVATAVVPDWQLLADSGADFVVGRTADLQRGYLKEIAALVTNEQILRLSSDVVIVRLPTDFNTSQIKNASPSFDNGYFRVGSKRDESATKLVNIAKHKPAEQSSTAGGAAKNALDGNTNGDFNLGSVSHSGKDANAWLQVDLEKSEVIDQVKIWNRTDCCGHRLRDYWIFISDTPFLPTDTVASLRSRSGTFGKVGLTPTPAFTIRTGRVSGRYVRIQITGDQAMDESFLCVAELEVFQADGAEINPASRVAVEPLRVSDVTFTTNNANYIRLDLESSANAKVEYLLWAKNPRLHFYRNRVEVSPSDLGGVSSIDIPPGKSVIEIKYRNVPFVIFWFFYLLYALTLLWFVLPERIRIVAARVLQRKSPALGFRSEGQ